MLWYGIICCGAVWHGGLCCAVLCCVVVFKGMVLLSYQCGVVGLVLMWYGMLCCVAVVFSGIVWYGGIYL